MLITQKLQIRDLHRHMDYQSVSSIRIVGYVRIFLVFPSHYWMYWKKTVSAERKSPRINLGFGPFQNGRCWHRGVLPKSQYLQLYLQQPTFSFVDHKNGGETSNIYGIAPRAISIFFFLHSLRTQEASHYLLLRHRARYYTILTLFPLLTIVIFHYFFLDAVLACD